METFKATHSPIAAAQSANSSSKLPFGLYLPCPKSHPYCAGCLQSYIMTKLDPEGDGSGNPSMVVFPLRCPECSLSEWADGIPDDVAARVLSEKNMTTWVGIPHRMSLETSFNIDIPFGSITRSYWIAYQGIIVLILAVLLWFNFMTTRMNHKLNVQHVAH